jgi:uncharacterized protein (TIGR00290 family)
MKPCWLWWSSGKDSAWTLYQLQQSTEYEVTALITSVNAQANRVAMHGVRREVLEAQAQAAGLPLIVIDLPFPCTNDDYVAAVEPFLQRAVDEGVEAMAFGDLFLADVRQYRCDLLSEYPLAPIFPLWQSDTTELAQTMMKAGLRAQISCLDPKQLPEHLAGHGFDEELLAELPSSAEPCGERGEFHTVTWSGPMFQHDLCLKQGETVKRGGFVFTDWLLRE